MDSGTTACEIVSNLTATYGEFWFEPNNEPNGVASPVDFVNNSWKPFVSVVRRCGNGVAKIMGPGVVTTNPPGGDWWLQFMSLINITDLDGFSFHVCIT